MVGRVVDKFSGAVLIKFLPFQQYIYLLTIVFLFLFPKGGIKINDIPLTWGYVLLGISSLVSLILRNKLVIRYDQCVSLLFAVAFATLLLVSISIYGFGSPGYTVSAVTNVLFLNIFFTIIRPLIITNIEVVFKYLKLFIRIGVIFALIQFLYSNTTREFLGIPYITGNQDDIYEIGEKHNNRGGIFKLVGFYNNGNIYGVCSLLLYPLYKHLENRKVFKVLFILTIFLTLSRTAWVGLVLYVLFDISRRQILSSAIGLIIIICLIWLASSIIGADFLFDSTLGGRIGDDFKFDISLLPTHEFTGISETLYLSLIGELGFIGLIFFLVTFYITFLSLVVKSKKNYLDVIVIKSLLVYSLVSFSDGVFMYTPVIAIFWFINSLSLIKNPYGET